jgi:hypothetical protein
LTSQDILVIFFAGLDALDLCTSTVSITSSDTIFLLELPTPKTDLQKMYNILCIKINYNSQIEGVTMKWTFRTEQGKLLENNHL